MYRGLGDDRCNLTPGILRKGMSSTADMQVFKEWAYIETFARHCDSIGLAIPNDSPAFREKFLNQNNPTGPGGSLSEWPPTEMHPLMALAQHYRLPTRLLDWSTRAYVAAYFAISDALAKKGDMGAERLAVWVLDIEKQPRICAGKGYICWRNCSGRRPGTRLSRRVRCETPSDRCKATRLEEYPHRSASLCPGRTAPTMRSGTSPKPMTGTEKLVILLYFIGTCV